MALKTRLEILEKDRDSALDQLIENEINVTVLERRTLIVKPGDEYTKLTGMITVKKENMENIKKVIEVIDEMMKKEKEVK